MKRLILSFLLCAAAAPTVYGQFLGTVQLQTFNIRLATAAAASSSHAYNLTLPQGSTGGTLLYIGNGQLPAATCTIEVRFGQDTSHLVQLPMVFTLSATSTWQAIPVPARAALIAQVTFVTCGATATTFDLYYDFGVGQSSTTVDLLNGNLFLAACDQTASVALSASGKTLVIAGITGKLTYVCHVDYALASQSAVALEYGITLSTSCDTFSTTKAQWPNTVLANAQDYTPFAPLISPGTRLTQGYDFCADLGTAATGFINVNFAQY